LLGVAVCAALAVLAGGAAMARAASFSWSAPFALDDTGAQAPVGVACPSATQCTAVDSSGGEVTFDPTSATPNSTPHTIDSGRNLSGVACPAATQCTAVDFGGGEVTFDPTSATPNSTPHTIDTGQSLNGVACPSATQCTAVDQSGGEVTFDPTSATPNSTPTHIAGANSLKGVACVSVSECVTVDRVGNGFTGRVLASPTLSASAPATGTAGVAISSTSISANLAAGSTPTGTITFKAFGPQSSAPSLCGSGGATVGTATVSGDGVYHPSAGFTPSSAGDYWWYASYGGDSNNNAAASRCGASMAETVVAAHSTAGPPTVSISAPLDGQSFTRLQVVRAGYSCQDGAGAPGIAACAGTVANGSPINTSTLGSHAFTVGARSKDGQTAIKTIHYTVVLPSNRFTVSHVKTHANGNVTFDLKLPGPGAVDAFESAWKNNVAWKHNKAFPASLLEPTAPHRFTFARLHTNASGAGTIHLTVHPNSRGKDLINHHRSVWIRLWVSYTPTGGRQRNHFGGFLHITHP
jgi:hypothetical protein